ncbi:response regulator transcription factor [Nonomuraea turkmeniaca]|uniref:Response regulator transcription factor n=1 Tax=Nonomuraea turkmeniaca TaxID=103838 RepID=A0A5S4FJF7_9ACTN|nr:helix-turn-helix domain-containing protein [Nonomuraea turkmeniaca]TMR20877.1 response regulator transcription factor [Nonomuraea turkmeniaca]
MEPDALSLAMGALPPSPEAEALYRELLKAAPVPEHEFLAGAAAPAAARRRLAGFLAAGLIRRDADGLLQVCPPRTALEAWAAQRELEAARARASAHALSELYSAAHGTGGAFVEVAQGKFAARELFRVLQAAARTEVRGLERGPYLPDAPPAPEEVQLDGMRRGLRYRAVYDGSVLHDEALLAAVREAVAGGEQARVFADVPMKLLLSDADRALIMLPHPGGGDADALLVYPSKLLEVLSELFEVFWRLGAPIQAAAGGPAAVSPDADRLDPGPDPDTQRLLVLLTAGLTDEAIARDLGVSERTVHRRVSRLQELLGARTRFQLGVQASRRGWL